MRCVGVSETSETKNDVSFSNATHTAARRGSAKFWRFDRAEVRRESFFDAFERLSRVVFVRIVVVVVVVFVFVANLKSEI